MDGYVAALEVSDDEAASAGGERLGPLVDQIDDPYLVAVSVSCSPRPQPWPWTSIASTAN